MSGQGAPGEWNPPQQATEREPEWGPPAGSPQAGPPPPEAATVTVPSWVASDWATAARIALVGQFTLLVAGVLVGLLSIFSEMLRFGIDNVDWVSAGLTPIGVLMLWAGGVAGTPLLVTGVLYTFLAYRFAIRPLRAPLARLQNERIRTLALAGKVGLVAAGVLLIAGILINSFAGDQVLTEIDDLLVATIDLTALVFLSASIGSTMALLALLSAGSSSLPRFLGLPSRSSRTLAAGKIGARRTLLAGGAGLLAVFTIGGLLDQLSVPNIGLDGVVQALLDTAVGLLTLWLDVALLLLLGATKFLHGGGFVWSFGWPPEPWMWVAIPLLAGAYIIGGVAAARSNQPRTQAEAMKAAVLVGPGVALVSLLAAIGWTGQLFIDDIVPIALLLPTLWGVVAVGGAWVWANQQGLASGVIVQREGYAPAPSPADQRAAHPDAHTGQTHQPVGYQPATEPTPAGPPSQPTHHEAAGTHDAEGPPPSPAHTSPEHGHAPATPADEVTRPVHPAPEPTSDEVSDDTQQMRPVDAPHPADPGDFPPPDPGTRAPE